MEATNLLRVEGGGGGYGGSSHGFSSHQDQKRQKLHALFDAIDGGDMPRAKQIFSVLMNFEPSLRTDPLFSKIGKSINENSIYAAQHFMRDLKARVVNEQVFKPKAPATPAVTSGESSGTKLGRLVNFQA